MAQSVTDTASDLGRKLVKRAETVVGDDAREAERRLRSAARSVRADYRYVTGSGPLTARKPAPRGGRKTASRGN